MAKKQKRFYEKWIEGAKKKSAKSKAWRALFLALFGLALAAWVGVVMFVVEYLAAQFLFRVLQVQDVTSVTMSIFQVVVYILTIAVTVFVPWKLLHKKTNRDELGLRGLPTWTDLLLAPIGLVVAMVLSGILTAICMAILPGINWDQVQNVGYNKQSLYLLGDFLLAFSCLVVLAPVCEEIIFRGWLYGKLRFRMSAVPAIIITSVLFGIMHGQWNVGVTVFAMSVIMCIMRELTGTIWGGVILHMIKNGLAFYFLFII